MMTQDTARDTLLLQENYKVINKQKMTKSIIVEYWRTLRQQKARALATIERATADLMEIEEKMMYLNEFVGIEKEEKRLERLEQESEREYDDCEDEEDTHPQMGER